MGAILATDCIYTAGGGSGTLKEHKGASENHSRYFTFQILLYFPLPANEGNSG